MGGGAGGKRGGGQIDRKNYRATMLKVMGGFFDYVIINYEEIFIRIFFLIYLQIEKTRGPPTMPAPQNLELGGGFPPLF